MLAQRARWPLADLAPALLALVGGACAAAHPRSHAPLSTDRPGFLFAPTVVPAGRVQVEAGLPTWSHRSGSAGESDSLTLPLALRYGLTDVLELRATLPVWSATDARSGGTSLEDDGWADSEVGAKIALAPLAGGPVAALASLRLPTGDDGFTTDEPGAAAYLLHGRKLGDFWLQTMAGGTHTPLAGAPDATTGALAALLARPLAERWSAYVELTALPGLSHAAGQGYAGAALIWNPDVHVQFDLSADFGLDGDSADALVALGVSLCR